MNHTTQIRELNTYVKTYIGVSKIAGVGVFALREILKGQKLYADMAPKGYTLPYSEFGKLFPEIRKKLLERFPQIVNGSHFAHPDTRIVAFMNHGFGDDVNYDAVNDVMLKDAKKDEEITENYKLIENYEKVFTFLL